MSTTVSSSTAAAIARPSAQEILAAVRDLQPWLREHQAAAENERRIPQETVELLDQAGVFHLTSPRRYGGAGVLRGDSSEFRVSRRWREVEGGTVTLCP